MNIKKKEMFLVKDKELYFFSYRFLIGNNDVYGNGRIQADAFEKQNGTVDMFLDMLIGTAKSIIIDDYKNKDEFKEFIEYINKDEIIILSMSKIN